MIRHIIMMGVSGCGKSSVGAAVSNKLGWRFIEGDDFHPAANIAKMRAGIPLTDEDRWPWLDDLNRQLINSTQRGESVVLACSALRQVYRDRLVAGIPDVQFIYLKGDRVSLLRNMESRRDHFMKPVLLDSQLNTLEEPCDAWVFPCTEPIEDITEKVRSLIHEE